MKGVVAVLALCTLMAGACRSQPQSGAASVSTSRLIYAAQNDGRIAVYDIDRSHRLVKTIDAFPCCADVRGATAAAPTHRFYVMYNRDNQGHVLALDLLTDQVVWDRVLHSPGVDRGNLTPDGMRLYLPTGDSDPVSPYELVVDAITGAELTRIPLPAFTHDTIVSLDGTRVFMETKSPTHAMYVADTASNKVITTIGGYCCSGILEPFSINGKGTKVVNDVYGYFGFSLADVTTGHVTSLVPFGGSGISGHGIAWSPDERQVWADERSLPLVHIFDMTAQKPKQIRTVTVPNVPHWLTFSIDGRFAYVAGRKGMQDPTEVIDSATYGLVGSLGASEDLLEVDLAGSKVLAVGNQFGVGRVR